MTDPRNTLREDLGEIASTPVFEANASIYPAELQMNYVEGRINALATAEITTTIAGRPRNVRVLIGETADAELKVLFCINNVRGGADYHLWRPEHQFANQRTFRVAARQVFART